MLSLSVSLRPTMRPRFRFEGLTDLGQNPQEEGDEDNMSVWWLYYQASKCLISIVLKMCRLSQHVVVVWSGSGLKGRWSFTNRQVKVQGSGYLAHAFYMSRCPWIYWSIICFHDSVWTRTDGYPSWSANGRLSVWMCVWMGECWLVL